MSLLVYKPGPDPFTGYFRLKAVKGRYRVFVSELILAGVVYKYSYTLLREEELVLRYDNAPHHLEVDTYPHHKHVGDRVEPLRDPSITAFLKEAESLVEQ